ncbi:hypothetical protein PAPYR_5850 [Paratrimastix pyriformis]|uniref:Uncharacterized protein n=1 Tax=Paratrimastix pyriformis TaxID=342808 RepID=A0ABQ8UGS8_9EUKA|nr:hypothetical protein PAPYR_5850 [Paratrimastix pyriformis]
MQAIPPAAESWSLTNLPTDILVLLSDLTQDSWQTYISLIGVCQHLRQQIRGKARILSTHPAGVNFSEGEDDDELGAPFYAIPRRPLTAEAFAHLVQPCILLQELEIPPLHQGGGWVDATDFDAATWVDVAFASLPNLRILHIPTCEGLTNATLRRILGHLPNLVALTLGDARILQPSRFLDPCARPVIPRLRQLLPSIALLCPHLCTLRLRGPHLADATSFFDREVWEFPQLTSLVDSAPRSCNRLPAPTESLDEVCLTHCPMACLDALFDTQQTSLRRLRLQADHISAVTHKPEAAPWPSDLILDCYQLLTANAASLTTVHLTMPLPVEAPGAPSHATSLLAVLGKLPRLADLSLAKLSWSELEASGLVPRLTRLSVGTLLGVTKDLRLHAPGLTDLRLSGWFLGTTALGCPKLRALRLRSLNRAVQPLILRCPLLVTLDQTQFGPVDRTARPEVLVSHMTPLSQVPLVAVRILDTAETPVTFEELPMLCRLPRLTALHIGNLTSGAPIDRKAALAFGPELRTLVIDCSAGSRLTALRVDAPGLENFSLGAAAQLRVLGLSGCPALRRLALERTGAKCDLQVYGQAPVQTVILEKSEFLQEVGLVGLFQSAQGTLRELTLLKCSPALWRVLPDLLAHMPVLVSLHLDASQLPRGASVHRLSLACPSLAYFTLEHGDMCRVDLSQCPLIETVMARRPPRFHELAGMPTDAKFLQRVVASEGQPTLSEAVLEPP